MYVPYSHPDGCADWMRLGTWIHFDPGSVLGKSKSRSEHGRHENGGVDSLHPEDGGRTLQLYNLVRLAENIWSCRYKTFRND